MKKLVELSENKGFLFFVWMLACFLLFLNGINSFISSSEFWSIYLSQKILSFDAAWGSVFLKPIFHLVLSTIYLLNLNDFYHIYATKILFSLNGILQFILIYRILSNFYKVNFVNFMLTVFLFLSPLFFKNYDRIRSDQLALTVYLFFIFTTYKTDSTKKFVWQILLLSLLPLIAFKHFYFSILCIPFLFRDTFFISQLRKLQISKLNLSLSIVAILTWALCLGWPAAHYFIESTENFKNSFHSLIPWVRSESIYIYMCIVPYFFPGFYRHLKKFNMIAFLMAQTIAFLIIIMHPQKFDFFIASFLPTLYFPITFFCQYLVFSKMVSLRTLTPLLVAFTFFSAYLTSKSSRIMTLNNPQLIAIERLSTIVSKNRLSYIDGMGILPRAKNLGCFVSPDDFAGNAACVEALNKSLPDAIILTNRLLSLNFDFEKLENLGYFAIGPNVFLKKDFINLAMPYNDWPPPSLIFTTEQIY